MRSSRAPRVKCRSQSAGDLGLSNMKRIRCCELLVAPAGPLFLLVQSERIACNGNRERPTTKIDAVLQSKRKTGSSVKGASAAVLRLSVWQSQERIEESRGTRVGRSSAGERRRGQDEHATAEDEEKAKWRRRKATAKDVACGYGFWKGASSH